MNKKRTSLKRSTKSAHRTVRFNGVSLLLSGIVFTIAFVGAITMDNLGVVGWIIGIFVVVMLLFGLYIMMALKIASQWEKAIVLRLGRFRGLDGPGMFIIIPIVDTIIE